MGEEVQLEAGAERIVGQGGDVAGDGGACVGKQDVDAAEAGDAGGDGGLGRAGGGDVAAMARVIAAKGGCGVIQRLARAIHEEEAGPLGGEGAGGGKADGPGAACDQNDATLQRGGFATAEFGLFERPVFHIEQVLRADGEEAAHGFAIGADAGGLAADIGGDAGGGGGGADAGDARAFEPDKAGHGGEHGFRLGRLGGVGIEIGAVAGGVVLHGGAHRLGRLGGAAQEQRFGLGADHVIGGGDAAGGEGFQIGAGAEGAVGLGCAEVDQGKGGAVGQGGSERAAQGREEGGAGGGGQGGGGDERGGAAVGQPGGDKAGMGEDAVIAGAGIGAPGEMAVIDQKQTFGFGVVVIGAGGGLGQGEARHDIGNEGEPVAEEFAGDGGDLGQVGEGEEGRGMGVIHDLVRDPGMQQGFHGWVGGLGIEEVEALDIDHRLVREGGQVAQAHQGFHPDGGQAAGLDRFEIPAGALDVQHIDHSAEDIRGGGFERGVATAMHDQIGIAPDEARGVDPQRQIAGPCLWPGGGEEGLGFGIVPEIGDHGHLLLRLGDRRRVGMPWRLEFLLLSDTIVKGQKVGWGWR